MPQPLSGAGVGLQVPQQLYPANLANSEITAATNAFSLAPGEALPIPAGRWVVGLGKYGVLQYLDPVTQVWTLVRENDNNAGTATIWSDGFNVRVANLTGCAIGAVVTASGSGYVQATTTVTPSTGNSTWQAIVGGAVNTSVTVGTAGANYGIAPLVFFDAPPAPGVQATGYATISSGSVTSITVTNQGAGYSTAPSVTIVPNPADPNLSSGITTAVATATLTGSGHVTAVLCTNPGAPVATSMTLTIAGAGSAATATPLFLETVTTTTVAAAGAGYGTATKVTTVGGYNSVASPAYTNPAAQLYNFTPRAADIPLTITGGTITSVSSIVDGGLFLSTPSDQLLTNGIVTTIGSVTLGLGGTSTLVYLQQVA